MDLHGTNLLVMRHAESLEDIDKTAYERIADEDMPLSERGKEQAARFGDSLAEMLGDNERLRIFLSPSKRVLETALLITARLPYSVHSELTTEPLIKKQDWGAVTMANREEIERERYRAGVLRYQFPSGEDGATLLARFDLFSKKLQGGRLDSGIHTLTIAITHGFEMRVLLKTLLGWSEEYFESLAHPRNCEAKRLVVENGAYRLLDEMLVHDLTSNTNFIRRQL